MRSARNTPAKIADIRKPMRMIRNSFFEQHWLLPFYVFSAKQISMSAFRLFLFIFPAVQLTACSAEKIDVEQEPLSAIELKTCIVWNKADSAVMELAYRALPSIENQRWERVLMYYEAMGQYHHRLSGMYLFTGRMHSALKHDEEAERYFRKELEHDEQLLCSELPVCRKLFILHDMEEACYLLNDSVKLKQIERYGAQLKAVNFYEQAN